MTQGLFITGTDTGVGKTVVAAALAAQLLASGLSVGVMKPIQTGCPGRRGRLIPTDALFLLKALGITRPTPGEIDRTCPYRFKAPLAPWVASEREGGSIEASHIIKSFRELVKRHDLVIVEGIGGLLTPLTEAATALDLARWLKLPTLVVANNRLGTLNHTLLTTRWAAKTGIKVAGVVFNTTRPGPKNLAERTNPAVFRRLSSVPVWGVFPFVEGLSVEGGRLGGVRGVGHHLDKGLHHLGIKLHP